jgi:hypothetical protein
MRRNVTSAGPGITVEKIELDPVSASVVTHGLPVTEAEVRLLCNLIVPAADGKSRLIPRGEVISLEDVPERWRTSEFIEALDQYRKNKIMMLHDFSCTVPNFDGQSTVWREKLFSAYSLVDPVSIPNRVMEALVEGQDYASSWDEDDRKVKEHERQNAVEEYSMEGPEIPDGYAENVHLPYHSL